MQEQSPFLSDFLFPVGYSCAILPIENTTIPVSEKKMEDSYV